MAIGKNKRAGGKKGKKKGRRQLDAFAKKVWYKVRYTAKLGDAKVKKIGWTSANKTAAGKTEEDTLISRVYEVVIPDLAGFGNFGQDVKHKKVKFICKAVDAGRKECYTAPYEFGITSDERASKIAKLISVIDAYQDVQTADGYHLRIFITATTMKQKEQLKKTTYAQSSQIRKIRKAIRAAVLENVSKADIYEVFNKLKASQISENVKKAAKHVFPLDSCYVRKVKVLRCPANMEVPLDNANKQQLISKCEHSAQAVTMVNEDEIMAREDADMGQFS